MKNFNTIKKRNHILQTKKYKNKIFNSYFNISYENNFQEISNILIISTKKNCPTSVKRNLLKRRIKEIFFQYIKKNKFFYNLVIYNKKIAFLSDFNTIKDNLLNLLDKILKKN